MRLLDLSNDDLENHPIWRYEGDSDDTATVQPVASFEGLNSSAYIARTRFTLGDGTAFWGYCSPNEPSGLDYIQPVIIHGGNHLPLWLEQPPHRPDLGTLASELRRIPGDVAPIRFECVMPLDEGLITGVVEW